VAATKYRLRWDGRRYYVPAALRKKFQSPWILTKSAEGLEIYAKQRWQVFLEKVDAMEKTKEKSALIRYKFAPAYEIDLRRKDLYIPQSLRSWAGLGQGDAVLTLEEESGEIVSAISTQ
jgi:DNA-binding transcriptional regulator/RsmH inhibitor MraZ